MALQYGVDITRLPAELAQGFVQLDADDSTHAWIDAALARPRPYSRMLLRGLAMAFVNLYDADGLTGICRNRLLGTRQWRHLLGEGGARLLDVGAGDGEVTRELAALFDDVTTTELSRPMARRLRGKGYTCHPCDLAVESIEDPGGFDVVALQNVIDRTRHPLRLLDRAGQLLARGGRLVVATPVPVQPVVFSGPRRFEPAERLPADLPDFESSVIALYEKVFAPRGYRVTALARAPYLCNGGVRHPFQVLDDAIFVLKPQAGSPSVDL